MGSESADDAFRLFVVRAPVAELQDHQAGIKCLHDPQLSLSHPILFSARHGDV